MSIKFNKEIKDELNDILSGLCRLNEIKYELDAECVRIDSENGHPVVILEESNTGSEITAFISREEGGKIYFDLRTQNSKSIYDNVGDFGWSEDQKLYIMYGHKDLYFDKENENIVSEEELKVWFEFAQDGGDPSVSCNYRANEFYIWLEVSITNGYLKKYRLFDVNRVEYPFE